MSLDQLAVAAIVLGAAAYLVAYFVPRSRSKAGCGGRCACPSAQRPR